MKRELLFVIPLLFTAITSQAQSYNNLNNLINRDSLEKNLDNAIGSTILSEKKQIETSSKDVQMMLDAQAPFGIFKDCYFATGVPLNKQINKESADAIFQLSIRHRITKSHLPFNSFAYITFTQKAFWDIYKKSSPFRDLNYNPGIGFGKYIIRNNKLVGAVFAQIEHESNGKDEEDSRSWNFMSIAYKYFFNPRFSTHTKVWIPLEISSDNSHLLRYRGFGTFSINYLSRNNKWWSTAEINPRRGWGNVNTTLSVAYKIHKSDNQYLYARFFNGKGDSLLNYEDYSINFRVGICIKGDFYSVY